MIQHFLVVHTLRKRIGHLPRQTRRALRKEREFSTNHKKYEPANWMWSRPPFCEGTTHPDVFMTSRLYATPLRLVKLK